jgi:hypothetical protein
MTTDSEKSTEVLEAELRVAEAAIDAAYWAFTRQARAKPPCLAVPWAYERRAEIREELSERRASGSTCAESRVSDMSITLIRRDDDHAQLQLRVVKSRNR